MFLNTTHEDKNKVSLAFCPDLLGLASVFLRY